MKTPRATPGTGHLASWARQLERSPLQKLLAQTMQPDVLSLALGLPDLDLFPQAVYLEHLALVLQHDPRALQYGPASEQLKTAIVKLMRERGVRCSEEQIFLTNGAQQGLSLLVHLLLEPGGMVLLEDFVYPGFQQVLAPFQPAILSVPVDRQRGIDVDAVAAILQSGARPAFLYTMSEGHNPLGISLPFETRRQLITLAQRYELPIIEDDAYGLLSYDGPTPPALRGLDEDWVFYVGSFSKTFAPALRAGWLIVPRQFQLHLSVMKEASDIDTATLSQRALASYLGVEDFAAHLERLRTAYRSKRDTLLAALGQHLPSYARWEHPHSGFFVWVELPPALDTTRLFEQALAQNMAFLPSAPFSVTRQARSSLRLNFSHPTHESIWQAIRRLGALLESNEA
jgi:2-aminoadipate transaminase